MPRRLAPRYALRMGERPMQLPQERLGAGSSLATRSNRLTRRYPAPERCRLFCLARARGWGTRPGGGTRSRVPASKRLEHEARHARVPLGWVVLDVLVHDGDELAGRTRRLRDALLEAHQRFLARRALLRWHER